MSTASDRLRNIHKVSQLEELGVFTTPEQSYAYLAAQGQAPKEKPAFFKAATDVLGGVKKIVGSIHPAGRVVSNIQDQMTGTQAFVETPQTVYGTDFDPGAPPTGILGLTADQQRNVFILAAVVGIAAALFGLLKGGSK